MNNTNGGRGTWPPFPVTVIYTVIAGLVATVAVAVAWRIEQNDEARRLCERSVAVREDGRAMWEWLIDAVADTSDLAPEARRQLDTLLPSLRCDDDFHPVPVAD